MTSDTHYPHIEYRFSIGAYNVRDHTNVLYQSRTYANSDEATFTDYLIQLMLVFYLALVIYYQCHSYTLYKNTLVLRHHRPHTDRLTN